MGAGRSDKGEGLPAASVRGWLMLVGLTLFETGQFFARPSLSLLSPQQDVVMLAGQLAMGLVALACALSWRRRKPCTGESRWLRHAALIAAGLCVASEVVVLVAPFGGGLVPAYLGSVVSGAGIAGCYLVWVVLFMRARRGSAGALLLLGALALSRVILLIVRGLGLDGAWLLFGFACLDVSLALMLVCAWGSVGERVRANAAPNPGRVAALPWRAYVPALLGMGLYSLLFGLITQMHNNMLEPTIVADQLSSVATLALLLALMARVRFADKPLRLENVFLVTVPIIAAVMALAALMHAGVSDATDTAAKTFFNLYLASLLVFLLQRPASDGEPLRSVALAYVVVWGCTLIGSGVGLVLLSLGALDSTVVTAVLLAAMWLCMLVSIALVKAARPEMPEVAGASAGALQVVYVDQTAERVRLFAEAAGLSEREREIVLLFVQGRSSARIASDLSLSENTVKTHLQNIYAKAGLHKKQELLDRVAEQRLG